MLLQGIRWGAVTETGLVRAKNEDSLCVCPSIQLFAVADGMGGHRAGEVASRLTLEVLKRELLQRVGLGDDPGDALAGAVQEANRAVLQQSLANPDYEGMGTTLSACLIQGRHVALAHVGDSRVYCLHGGVIKQLTEDHSLAHELAKQGQLEGDNPQSSPLRNVLTRALGTREQLVVDIQTHTLKDGDCLVLCTDGLTNLVADDEIAAVVQEEDDPAAAAGKLVQTALARGGTDNISLIVVVIKE